MSRIKQCLNGVWKRQQLHSRLQSTSSNTTGAVSDTNSEWQQAKPYESIPSMSKFAMIRHFLPGGKYSKLDLTQLFLAIKEDLGPISVTKAMLGRQEMVITHNPEDFERVFRHEGKWPTRLTSEGLSYHREVHRADFFQGVEGITTTQGEKWASFRSKVNPVMMQPKTIRLYLQKISDVNKELIDIIYQTRDAKTFEVPAKFEEELNRWALESVSVVALDQRLGLLTTNRDNPAARKLFQSLTEVFVETVTMDFGPPIWKYYKTNSFKKVMTNLDNIVDICSQYINGAIKHIEEDRRNGVAEKPDREKSVLEKLIKIDKKVATVMALDMLIAGVDTTSSAFSALLFCLAKNPEKQSKLREEILKVLPDKNSEFNEETLENIPYLRACIKEALRCYPVTSGSIRVVADDVVLSGYKVPKGTNILMFSADESHYPKPTEYLPERWLRTSKEDVENSPGECPHSLKSKNPFTFIPFGFGPRMCIGRRIVEMEIELGIARLIRNFHVEYNYPTDNAYKSYFINIPNIPLKFKFTNVEV